MSEEPAGYDREWSSPVGPNSRLRIGYSHDRGEVTRFVVQLEYRHGGEWSEVLRADHAAEGDMGHDVTEEGVHIDVYRDGEKLRSEEIFPPMDAGAALTYAEEHLTQHAERYVERFEEWHEIDRGSR